MTRKDLNVPIFFAVLLLAGIPTTAYAWPFAPSGQKLYQDQKFEEAKKKLLEDQVKNPEDVEISYALGNTQYRLGDYAAAEKAYQDVLQAAPEENKALTGLRKDVLYNLGNVTYQQGRLEEAIQFFEGALALDPTDEDAKHNLEFVKRELEKRKQESQQPKKSSDSKNSEKNDQKDDPQNQPQQDQQQQAGGSQGQGEQNSAEKDIDPSGSEALLQNLNEKRPPRAADPQQRARGAVRAPGGKNW